MDAFWKERILELKGRSSEAEEEEYVSLVDAMMRKCTLDIARVLMKTFVDEPDYGIQESVVSVLASAESEVYLQALLEELPRLIAEAPEWAETLVGRAIDLNSSILISTAKQMNPQIREMLIQLLLKPSLVNLHADAKQISKALRSI